MGSNFQADIAGNWLPLSYEVQAIASNGGAAAYALFVAPQAMRVTAFWYCPDSGDQAITASDSASYRRLTIIDGGAAGTGTVVMGTLNLQTSVASKGYADGTMATTPVTLDAGDVVLFSQGSVGGNHNVNTVLAKGKIFAQCELG